MVVSLLVLQTRRSEPEKIGFEPCRLEKNLALEFLALEIRIPSPAIRIGILCGGCGVGAHARETNKTLYEDIIIKSLLTFKILSSQINQYPRKIMNLPTMQ